MTDTNREAWLTRAVATLNPLFTEHDIEVPEVLVSVGWPGGRGPKGNIRGQCWTRSASLEPVNQIFISPSEDDVPTVLAILTHELIHAVDDCDSGHRGLFARIARTIGLIPPLTSSTPCSGLLERLAGFAEELGPFGHPALSIDPPGSAPQKTRMRKLECPIDGYLVRTTAKWLEVGLPSCPCGEELQES